MKGLVFAALLASAAVVVAEPAKAGCSGSWSGSSFSGQCRDSDGGNYRIHGGGMGNTSVSGYTGDGRSVSGSVNSMGTFNGYVGNRYVSCTKWGCY